MNRAAEARPGFNGVRVLVLGATGFIGRWVVRHLDARGADVVPHARDGERAQEVLSSVSPRKRMVEADLAPEGIVAELVRRVRPSIVFNLVGYGVDPAEAAEQVAFRINGALVGELCRATVEHGEGDWPGPRLVHVGSALEYGEAAGDLSEDTEPAPTTLYGRSKLAGTLRLHRFSDRTGFPAITARLFTVYGPGEHEGRLLPSLISAAETGAPLDLTRGQQERDFTYVEDVADGLLRLAQSPAKPGEVVNLATGRLTSVRAFVLEAAEVLGLSGKQLRFGARPTREEEMEHDPVSVRRLERLTGWRPGTTIRAGVRKTLEHRRPPGPERERDRRPGRGG